MLHQQQLVSRPQHWQPLYHLSVLIVAPVVVALVVIAVIGDLVIQHKQGCIRHSEKCEKKVW